MIRRLFGLTLLGIATLKAGEAGQPLPLMKRAVLVHGIWQNDFRCYGFLRHDLESRGVEVLVPTLTPLDGRDGLEPMARQLKTAIDERFGPDEPFTLVAFSMGGLISRSYLQDLGGAGRCEALFTISTPHHGTRMACLHYGKGAAQMRPGSPFLTRLGTGEEQLGGMPIVSYRTPMDLIIVPSESSVWDRADNISIPCPLHPMMTFSPRVRNDILSRFRFPVEP